VFGGRELHADGIGQLFRSRHSGVYSAVGFDFPEGNNNRELYGERRRGQLGQLFIQRNGERYSSSFDHLSGQHNGAEFAGPVLGGCQLPGCDCERQLPWSWDSFLCAGVGSCLSEGNHYRDLFCDGRRREFGELFLHGDGE